MSTIPELLAEALTKIQLGQLGRAEEDYQQVLRADPNHAEALEQIGLLAYYGGRTAQAVEYLRRSVAAAPENAERHNNLGVVLAGGGHTREAEAAYREALRRRPNYPEAHVNLANVLRGQGRWPEAELECRVALRQRPDLADAHNSLGCALHGQGRPAEAEAAYREALYLRPEFAEAHNNLANALGDQGRPAEAEAAYREALQLRPTYAEAHNNLANALHASGRWAEAEAAYRTALRLRPDYADAHNNLGSALRDQGRLAEAEAAFRQALRLRPEFPDAHTGLGALLLSQGRYADGWAEYEWRWQTGEVPVRRFRQPRWDGASLAGRTILLYAEQGLGDTLQFIRYTAVVKRRGATVVAECAPALLPLLRRCPGVDTWVAAGEALPPFDVQAPLMSLPHLCGTTLANVPAEVPYLFADPERVERWRERLSPLAGFKIGIAWRGSKYSDQQYRSLPLRSFASLAAVPGVRLVSLQKGAGVEQLAAAADLAVHELGDGLDEAGAFVDTAAVMQNLDLVVSADTAVAHLAGGLGVPVWVAQSHVPNFRWLAGREDSPWYPTMRLFHRPQPGDWGAVFERMAEALRERLATK